MLVCPHRGCLVWMEGARRAHFCWFLFPSAAFPVPRTRFSVFSFPSTAFPMPRARFAAPACPLWRRRAHFNAFLCPGGRKCSGRRNELLFYYYFVWEKNSFKSSGVHSIASPPCFCSGQYLYLIFTPCFTSSSTRVVQSPSLAVLKK